MDEEKYNIAQASAKLDDKGHFAEAYVAARHRGEFLMAQPEEIHFIDVSPKQIISVSTALIPFLEHDDANRALMGSNMQRQAVPLLRPEAPLIGTGMERRAALDSGVGIRAQQGGKIAYVVQPGRYMYSPRTGKSHDVYPLIKYKRTNQDTCFNQKPIVKLGDKVKKGDVIADGPATDIGELALGKNVLVAFMPWMGYNYEDAILMSERIVKEDLFTSIHIEQFDVEVRETKLGMESITLRHPQRKRRGLQGPRRRRGRESRGERFSRLDTGGKGHPEGGNRHHPGIQASELDLRREGEKRERHLPPRAPRDRGNGHRHKAPPPRGRGRARPGRRRGGQGLHRQEDESSRRATSSPAVTGTRASSRRCSRSRTCPSSGTARRWTSF